MRLNFLSDANWDSGVSGVLSTLSSKGYRKVFESRNYGDGLLGITIVFMCRDPSLKFERRVRMAKKILYMDVMLDLDQMRSADPETRSGIIIRHIIEDVPSLLRKRKLIGFDTDRFIADLRTWFKTHHRLD